MYDLATHLEALNEETTMDAVSFLPSQLGVVQSALKKLAQEKLDWDIEILEGEASHSVKFGDRLQVDVPIKDWNAFTSLFGRDIRQDKSINLRGGYTESVVMKPPKFRVGLRKAINRIFGRRKVQAFERITAAWEQTFPQRRYLTGTVPAIQLENKKKSIAALIHAMEKKHSSSASRKQALSNLREMKDLNKDPVLKKHAWFAGTKIASVYEGVSMVFEASLSHCGSGDISIVIHDPEVVAEVAKRMPRGTAIKNVFCVTEKRLRLIHVIKSVIDEMLEETELEEMKEKENKVAEDEDAQSNQ